MKGKLFKNREKRRQFMIIAFTLLVGFTFLIGIVLVPLSYNDSGSVQETTQDIAEKFTKQQIFDEPLSEIEKQFILERGMTLATYYYVGSSDFFELESLVMSINAQPPTGQLILEKVPSNKTKIEFDSLKDFVIIDNFSQQEIFEGLCKTLVYPPPDCAIFTE